MLDPRSSIAPALPQGVLRLGALGTLERVNIAGLDAEELQAMHHLYHTMCPVPDPELLERHHCLSHRSSMNHKRPDADMPIRKHHILMPSSLQVLSKEGWDSAMMRRCRLAFFGKVCYVECHASRPQAAMASPGPKYGCYQDQGPSYGEAECMPGMQHVHVQTRAVIGDLRCDSHSHAMTHLI